MKRITQIENIYANLIALGAVMVVAIIVGLIELAK